MSSAIGLKICAITAEYKICKSIMKKKKDNKIILLAKSKLNIIEVLIFNALIDSVCNRDEFVLINNLLKEQNKTKEEVKHLKT